MKEFNFNGMGCLFNAIVMQACEDYFTCKRTIAKGKNSWGKIADCKATLTECIDFFNGSWYELLTKYRDDLDGQLVMQRLDEMVADTTTYPHDYKPFKYGLDEVETEE